MLKGAKFLIDIVTYGQRRGLMVPLTEAAARGVP